ncbi:hypothetical protein [Paracoccus binzhouensis]|uniref:hypothetical protein n=1 Tax=Paracoccus binzhouensis TaxID=2796149 RepID=UPI0018EEEBEA|nr:hypothetical protein [Paracoccus binzhouensis]
MDPWDYLEYAAWGASAAFALAIVADWLRTDSTYSEDFLTSSREGELEALTEDQHRG